MPVKNKARPTQSGFEGEIVNLNENEKKVLKEFITEEQKIPTKVSELENDAGYITKEVNDLVNYPTKEEIDSKITAVYRPKGSCAYADLPASPEVGDVYNVTDAHEGHPAGTNYVWTGSVWDALSGVVDLTPYLTKEEATSTYATKQSVSEVEAKIPSTEGLATTAEVSEATKDAVKYKSFQNPGDTAERKTIQLANHDTLSGLGTDGKGYNIAMVSKWDKVDLGAAGLSINLNGKDARPTYNDKKEIALLEDIPSVDNLATKTEIPVAGVNYFALTDISDAEHSNRHSMMMKNDDSISGYALKDNQAYNLVMVNKWDVADFGSRGLPINLNGNKERPTYNDDKEIALVDDLEWLPVICNMPFRTLSDKVYTQDEIFAWFFVKDLVGLKNTVLKHPIYLRYGISLSGNPMYYYIPCQYVAFTDTNTLEMITDGLDTKNDKFSRYHITIKLDGTVIKGASNIKVELKENVFVPDLPEDVGSNTYQLKAINGTLEWVKEE